MISGKDLNQNIRQVGFVILMITLTVLIGYELKFFFSAALGAFTLYMLLRMPHRWLMGRGWPKMLATMTLILASVAVLLGAGGGILSVILPKIKGFSPQIVIDNLNSIHDYVLSKTGYNIFSKDIVDKAMEGLGNALPDIFTATGGVLVNGFMSFVILFFMLQGNRSMEDSFSSRLPLRAESIAILQRGTHDIVVSNAIGIPIIIIGHSVISGLAYWWLGAGDPVAWGLITGIAGLLPVIGTAGVWIPLAVNLIADGQIWQGIMLIAYGALIVANTDNVLRMALLKKYADVHPLVTLFGIILGINLFGFWGIIFGPLLISGSMMLLHIYRMEFMGICDVPKENSPG